MKSKGRAIIIVYVENAMQSNYRLIMRLDENVWEIDEIAFPYSCSVKWKIEHYM